MSRSFLTSINLNQNQLISAQLHNLAAAPSSPVNGQIYYNTVTNASYVYNGTAWQPNDATKLPANSLTTSQILNFASTVQGYSLSLFAAPTGNIAMGGFTLTGLATPTAAGQAAEYAWVVGRNLNTIAAGAATTANWSNGGFKITSLGTPTTTGDAATYDWTLARPVNSFAAATGNLAMGGNQITGLNTTQTASGQAASYDFVIAQVQASAAGIASKPPVQCVSTSNITLSGLQALDGYTTLANDRVLVAGQTTQSANGVYNASAGAWTRTTTDGAAPGEIEPGAMWLIVNGTVYGGSQWRCSNTGTITLGTTAVTMVQFGAASLYSAGNGITLTGTAFSVNAAASVSSGGPGGGLVVSGSGVAIDTNVVARKYSGTIGDGSSTSIVVTHGLNTQDVVMMVRLAGTPYSEVDCDMSATSTTTATFAFAVAPAASSLRVTVLG